MNTTTTTDDALLKLARKIVADLPQYAVEPVTVDAILSGRSDYWESIQSALAAIRETTRLAAEMLGTMGSATPGDYDSYPFARHQLEQFAHLKETHSHDQ